MAQDAGRRGREAARGRRVAGSAAWRGGWRVHGPALALFALGAGVGLALWGRWGFLVAFDTIRAYCF